MFGLYLGINLDELTFATDGTLSPDEFSGAAQYFVKASTGYSDFLFKCEFLCSIAADDEFDGYGDISGKVVSVSEVCWDEEGDFEVVDYVDVNGLVVTLPLVSVYEVITKGV